MNEQSSNGKAIAGLVLGIVLFFPSRQEMKIQQASPLPDLYAPLSELYYVQ